MLSSTSILNFCGTRWYNEEGDNEKDTYDNVSLKGSDSTASAERRSAFMEVPLEVLKSVLWDERVVELEKEKEGD